MESRRRRIKEGEKVMKRGRVEGEVKKEEKRQ